MKKGNSCRFLTNCLAFLLLCFGGAIFGVTLALQNVSIEINGNVIYTLPVPDASEFPNLGFTYNSDSTAKVTGYTATGDVVIPEKVKYNGVDYTVTRVDFEDSKITSAHIPATVTGINFLNCPNATSVTFAEGSQLKGINPYTFMGCASLKSIKIPKNVTWILNNAFQFCTSLASVTFEEGTQIERIANSVFADCSSLSSITFPATVTTIGTASLTRCSALTSIMVEEGNTVYSSYENGIYMGTTLIVGCQTTIIKEGTTEIGYRAFEGQTKITSITIPASVTSIGNSAFSFCTSLASVTFEEGTQIEYIGNLVFADCSSLSSITFPATVTAIGMTPLTRCSALTSIMVEEGNTVYSSYENGIYMRTTLIQGCQTTIIKEGTTEIGCSAFEGQTKITSITIPASVTNIGRSAFYNCTNLTSATFENTKGWSVTRNSTTTQLSSTDLANTTTAATYLTDTYYPCTWNRT